MASSSSSHITITVTHRGLSHSLAVDPTSLLTDLQQHIEDLTNVPISHQKLLYKGKKTSRHDETQVTLEDFGLKDGVKVMLVGGTKEEVGEMQREEDEAKRKERIDRERRGKPQAKLRSTGPSSSSSSQYKFHAIRPHPQLPSSPAALGVLNRLADDPAIRHVMQVHKFIVGVLTEFAPHEHPDKLGYNTNAGQMISLRIRTNLYDGFRPYLDIRKVLLHELTHNVWGDHDNNFKELNSQLNREVLGYERSLKANTHSLSDSDGWEYDPSASEREREATSFVLGGGDPGAVSLGGNESQAERRRRILEATMARLRREEEELEGACGTGGPASSS
ncbi:WLM domain-containing protein [Cristinia sonorae]|uniref:WLM domain-containing protein n=1 Tax=Cristinia sonorae TaxID=1940300 RepID=A0A8K0UI51_9AGAR|nr:WLM domain-containing protein [Cristinia sonorae]